ncbi:MAG: hypothetical protein R3268_05780 [Acidiferrobacterales bacterium]|nr:hypothetical protein [Acidiferrobacterales bacterium]
MKEQGHTWPRSRLARDIAIVVTVKVLALIVIKFVWFSDPPVPVIPETLLGPARAQAR